jgi:hypothetical protein
MSPAWSLVGWSSLAIVGLAVAAAAIIGRFRRLRKSSSQRPPLAIIKRRFHAQRERLEAKFVHLAATSSDAETRRWAGCSFADDVAYVRSRATGELAAFVAVTISPEDAETTGYGFAGANRSSQAGTAIFRFDRDHWETDGRAIRNLSPAEAVRHYRSEFEVVSQEVAHPA